VSAEKESGALKLMLQAPVNIGSTLAAKGIIILVGWLLAWMPGLIAIALWKSYGGHLQAPEAPTAGTQLQGYLNGKLLLEYTLAEPVSGKIGVWSKTDSVSYFDDFIVTPKP
jgi:hypothetical protein